MTYRDALTHSLSALLFTLSGCVGLDDPGQDSNGDDPIDDPSDDDDDDDGDDDDVTDEEDPETVECGQEHLELAFAEAGPSGIGGKQVFGMAAEYTEGAVTFHGGDTRPMTLEVIHVEGPVAVTHADGSEEGCEAYTQIRLPIELLVLTEGGALAEIFDATLVHHSADPESVEVVVSPLLFDELGGSIQAPKSIGPGGHSAEDFDSLELHMRMVLGEPRPMSTVGEEVLEEVQGVILGSGVLPAESCGGEGDGCVGTTHEFFLGSIELDQP